METGVTLLLEDKFQRGLFGDQDKKRKMYMEDLWKERKRQVQLRCEGATWSGEVWRGSEVKKEELASASAIVKARLGTASDLILI